ncbi:MAG: hypothetical protein ACK5MR_15525 [Cumulibacter sp.]
MTTAGVEVLHALRLLGFADAAATAERAAVDIDVAIAALDAAENVGWVQHSAFADLDGWSLTTAGRAENERRLAAERNQAGATAAVASAYRDFLPLNGRLVRAVSDWQLAPTHDDPLAPNVHVDVARDTGILYELGELSAELRVLIGRLVDALPRFSGYDLRFDAALAKAMGGGLRWVDGTNIDSCHRVWFELHEDLIATLGIDRVTEA